MYLLQPVGRYDRKGQIHTSVQLDLRPKNNNRFFCPSFTKKVFSVYSDNTYNERKKKSKISCNCTSCTFKIYLSLCRLTETIAVASHKEYDEIGEGECKTLSS
jgi:hypothetical protein